MNASPSILRSIALVLVRPESPGNVGAVARIIRNFGFGALRIVGEPIHRDAAARRLAHRSLGVLRKTQVFPDLRSAVGDCQWVVGTSGRARSKTLDSVPVRAAAMGIVSRASVASGALVFGPESDGLSLHDLAQCDEVVRIPQRSDGPALNLAQAVAICGSELFQAALLPGTAPPPALSDRTASERIAERMGRVARHCGLPVRNRPEEFSETARRMLAGHEYTPHELAVLERFLAQIEWFVGLSNSVQGGSGWNA